jgi:hypothetical protein
MARQSKAKLPIEVSLRGVHQAESTMGKELIVKKSKLPQSPTARRAAQYVRMSTKNQRYSIENQSAVIGTYANLHQLSIVRTYRDEAKSGPDRGAGV